MSRDTPSFLVTRLEARFAFAACAQKPLAEGHTIKKEKRGQILSFFW